MDSVGVGAVTGRRYTDAKNLNICAIIEFEMRLRAVLNCYPGDRYTIATIEPQSLRKRTPRITLLIVFNN